MEIASILLTVVLVAVSVLIVLIVLLQRPKQEGLGTAFGGSSLDSALGAHTSDVLVKITTWFGVIFFVSAITLSMLKARQFKDSAANNLLEEVEKREPIIPGNLPSSLTGLPKSEETKPATKPEAPKPATKPAEKKDKAPAKPKATDKKAKTPAPTAPPKKSPSPADSDKPAK